MEIRMKQVRKSKKLTLKEIAELVGVTESTVSKYETCKFLPSDAVIQLFCQKLHISESWLRTGEGEMEEKDLLAELTARYQLGPAGQALLRAVARVFSEFDEETASRIVDDVLAELQSSVAARSIVVADPSSRAVSDPQSPADQESSAPLPGSVIG